MTHLVLLFVLLVPLLAQAGTYTVEVDDAVLAHAQALDPTYKDKKPGEYLQAVLDARVVVWREAHQAANQADLTRAAKECLAANKTFIVETDKETGQPTGVCK